MREIRVEDLEFGDLIIVDWSDASECTGSLEKGHWDTRVHSIGYFVGIKGQKRRHIVIAKEIVNRVNFHYNVIPIEMINNITMEKKNALRPQAKQILKKFASVVIPKLKGKDGWAYARKMDKKKTN